MSALLSYVYDDEKDPFVSSGLLIKGEYLPYYINDAVEEEYVSQAFEIEDDLTAIIRLFKKFRRSNEANLLDSSKMYMGKSLLEVSVVSDMTKGPNEEVNFEKKVGTIFSNLELMLGLQDQDFSIRLLLAEKRVPFFLVELLYEIQITLRGDKGMDLFIRGLKILKQLTKYNYPAQAQITKGECLEVLFLLILEQNSAFVLLLFCEIFQDDNLFLHINTRFVHKILNLFETKFVEFYTTFLAKKSTSSKNIVELFMTLQFIKVILNTDKIPERHKQAYYLYVSKILHIPVVKFVVPLFKGNHLEVAKYYEPKLIKKTWSFENCYSLSALMQLSREHKRSMLMDFSHSVLSIYNSACQKNYPGRFLEDINKCLPKSIDCFDYLNNFREGLYFKTEVLILYCNFKIFPMCKKIADQYTARELSPESFDTFLDFMPKDHLRQVPVLIKQELDKFAGLEIDRYDEDDVVEYLLRGVFQLLFKYCKGIHWFGNGCDTDEIITKLSENLRVLNASLFNVKQSVNLLKGMGPSRRGNISPRKNNGAVQHISLMTNQILSSSVRPLISSLKQIYEKTDYAYIIKMYTTRKDFVDQRNMSIVKNLLSSEASYVKYAESTENLASLLKKERKARKVKFS